MTTSKFHASLRNIQSQLNLEIISFLSKDIGIKSLEDLLVKLGYDPKDVKATEEIVRRKNVDIVALRKQLKLLSPEDPQDKEVGEIEKEKVKTFKIIRYGSVDGKTAQGKGAVITDSYNAANDRPYCSINNRRSIYIDYNTNTE